MRGVELEGRERRKDERVTSWAVKRRSSSGMSLAKMVEEAYKHPELRKIQTGILNEKDGKFPDGETVNIIEMFG